MAINPTTDPSTEGDEEADTHMDTKEGPSILTSDQRKAKMDQLRARMVSHFAIKR
jgi:hypothetical protein